MGRLADHLHRLRCPLTGGSLVLETAALVTVDGTRRYPVTAAGVPMFAQEPMRTESRVQQAHYDRMGGSYVEHLHHPHTREYVAWIDRLLLEALPAGPLGVVGEICCGGGEGLRLLRGRVVEALIGVDISGRMLDAAAVEHTDALLVQGDATSLPLADASLDLALMLGGIHHVNARARLFAEIFRVLRPGGRLVFREPVDDFAPWRWLRLAVYHASPQLDAATERPLRHDATVTIVRAAGFEPGAWRTTGFAGYCLFVNSDVLVFNRVLRFVPGIRYAARLAARLDDWIVRLPGLKHCGLQVVGTAVKPVASAHRARRAA